MRVKQRFTKARHEQIGAALEPMRSYLLDLSAEIANAYPAKSPQAIAGKQVVEDLDELISRLDQAAYAENPGQKTSKGERLCRIYYPRESD